MPAVDFDSTVSDGFAGFLDPGPFETIHRSPAKRRWFFTHFGFDWATERRASVARRQLWAVRSRLGAGGHDRHGFLVRRHSPHDALGIAKVAIAAGATSCCCRSSMRALCRGHRQVQGGLAELVPTMLALALARTCRAGANRPVLGRNRAYRFRADHPIADRRDQTSFPRRRNWANWLWHDGIGSDRFWGTSGLTKRISAIGWPLPGVEVRLVGPDGTDATEGELWISHPCQHGGILIFRKKPDRS